jgi:glycosyltransferase involved in cell wall biosynthesis
VGCGQPGPRRAPSIGSEDYSRVSELGTARGAVRQLRIGHFLAHFPDPGGTTTMLIGLSEGLIHLGHRVYAYGSGGRRTVTAARAAADEASYRIDQAGINVRLFHAATHLRVPFPSDSKALTSRLATNRDRLDLMVVHGAFGIFSSRVARACRRAHVPVIACPHDPYSPELFGSRRAVKTAYWHLIEARYLQGTTGIHLLAPSHLQHLRNRGIRVPAFVVPNGIDPAFLDYEKSSAGDQGLSVDGDELRVLYFGRWDIYNKGLDLLLRAMAQEGRTGATRLEVAGRGSEEARRTLLGLIASFGLQERVSLVGFVPDIQMAIRSAEAVILPSRFDGFGQVVLESLVLGTPVILSSRAGASEYLGEEHGVLAMNPGVPGIAAALKQAARSRNRLRRAARSGRQFLEREFSWKVLAERWVEGVDRAIAERASSKRS